MAANVRPLACHHPPDPSNQGLARGISCPHLSPSECGPVTRGILVFAPPTTTPTSHSLSLSEGQQFLTHALVR